MTLVARGFFTAVFPSDCSLCDAPLTNISRLPVCPECLDAIVPISSATCEICGEAIPAQASIAGVQTCAECREDPPRFTRATAFGAYEDGLRGLIHLLKYESVLPAAGFLGGLLAQAIAKLEIDSGGALIVPVPLHRSKRRERGFNQAEMIAKHALKRLRRPQLELAPGLLVRVRPTASQIGLTRPQRAENLRGAFETPHPMRVAGQNILLVDDVLTTGTTASECARVLKKAGADQVWVATVARTLKESDRTFAGKPALEAVSA